MRETGRPKTCVWRWQERFASEGFEGLLRDKTRPSRIKKLDPSIAERVVAPTMEPLLAKATHWTGAAMAQAAGVSVSSVQRIWRAHGLQPHRGAAVQAVQRPRVRRQAARRGWALRRSPAHAVVLYVDEKSQIQALNRTQPGLPMKKGRAGAMGGPPCSQP
jgi:Homeodomain-like domain